MPHCIIEHANDLTDLISPEEMMDAALKAMQASELFETDDIIYIEQLLKTSKQYT